MASKRFKIFMYQDEINYLKWLVLQKPNIETGGDLFGLWRNEDTAVVQLVLGPGKECSRTTTSFHQDVEYLSQVGQALTSTQGLCNIGEWHSHHRIGLARPSYGDKNTVWNHISDVAGGRFLVYIANIEGPTRNSTVNIGCFVFHYGHKKILDGKIEALPRPNPLRYTLNEIYMQPGAEANQDWETFQNTTKSVSQSRDKGKCRRFLSWLGDVLCRCFMSLKECCWSLCSCRHCASCSCCPCACRYQQSTGHTRFD